MKSKINSCNLQYVIQYTNIKLAEEKHWTTYATRQSQIEAKRLHLFCKNLYPLKRWRIKASEGA